MGKTIPIGNLKFPFGKQKFLIGISIPIEIDKIL